MEEPLASSLSVDGGPSPLSRSGLAVPSARAARCAQHCLQPGGPGISDSLNGSVLKSDSGGLLLGGRHPKGGTKAGSEDTAGWRAHAPPVRAPRTQGLCEGGFPWTSHTHMPRAGPWLPRLEAEGRASGEGAGRASSLRGHGHLLETGLLFLTVPSVLGQVGAEGLALQGHSQLRALFQGATSSQ